MLFNPPGFHSSGPPRPSSARHVPAAARGDLGAFAAWSRAATGPAAASGARTPSCPPSRSASWQVWNEPSLPVYWPTGPDPKAYTRLLAATGEGDPRRRPGRDGRQRRDPAVAHRRAVRALRRGHVPRRREGLVRRRSAIHPYARDTAGVIAAIVQARRIMDRHGDHSPIWVTEVGWASGGPPSDFTVGPRGQAQRGALDAARRWPRSGAALGLRGVVYFGLRDSPVYPGGHDFWGLHTGLLRDRGRAEAGVRGVRECCASAMLNPATLAQRDEASPSPDHRRGAALRSALPATRGAPTTSPASSPTTCTPAARRTSAKQFAVPAGRGHRDHPPDAAVGRRRDRAEQLRLHAVRHVRDRARLAQHPGAARAVRPAELPQAGGRQQEVHAVPEVQRRHGGIRGSRRAALRPGRHRSGTRTPSCPTLTFTSYQIWNEPNLPVYSRRQAQARPPTSRCCGRSAPAIKALDPTAEIVTARAARQPPVEAEPLQVHPADVLGGRQRDLRHARGQPVRADGARA